MRFENACPKSGVSPPPINRGPKNHLFRWFRNLRATLTAYIFGVKHDIHNWPSALQTTRGLLHHLKMTWTLVGRCRALKLSLSCEVVQKVVLGPPICRGRDTQISDMCFQIALTSDHVADFGWVTFSELSGYVAKKERTRNTCNYSDVLPLKAARRDSISNLTSFGASNLSCRRTQCRFI